MKLMCPQKRFALLVISFFLAFAFLTDNISAQSKKKTTAKKPTASAKADVKKKDTRRKDASNSRSAKKASAKDSRSAKNDRSKKSNSRTAKNEPKAKKLSAREQARLDAKSKKAPKETKRQAAERRRQEEIRRQAALAEQRRREQAAREARERRLAFERGLRTETVDNIAKDNTDGEDIRVRNAAIEALGNRAGTVVVMESQTGKLLTVVNQDWAIKNGFKPCSTIKLVTGVGGLNESVINGDGTIAGDSMSMNLDTALAFSKNPYFQRVGVKMGNAKMIDYARTLGLGQRTGINAEGETPGKLPYGNSNPRVYSHGDDFEVTPLQLAVLVSALSNGGNKVVPHMVRPEVERAAYKPQFSGRLDIPQERYQRMLPGMMGAAEYGTARRINEPSLGIAGKTGSCIGKGSWVGLFASVAPVENPKYAVVVITRGQSERGKYAAAVAGRIYRELAPRITRDQMKYMAIKQQSSINPVDARTAVADDEDDDAAEGDANAEQTGNAVPTILPKYVPLEPKKTVVKTASSQPVFSPVVIPYKKDTEVTADAPKSRPRIVKNEK